MHIEIKVVPSSHTVIDPRTMMVESIDTLVTNIAMSTARHSNDFTERTKRLRLKLLHKSQKLDVFGLFCVSRISKVRNQEK